MQIEGEFDILFILTPTGSMNHEGTAKFVDHLQSNLKERIKFVICLDSIVDILKSPIEYLYMFTGPVNSEEPILKEFTKKFNKSASIKGLKLMTQEVEIITNGKYNPFEH